jgi:transposase-like protein
MAWRSWSRTITGLKQAIREVLAEAAWQRCGVHFLRKALEHVPRLNCWVSAKCSAIVDQVNCVEWAYAAGSASTVTRNPEIATCAATS